MRTRENSPSSRTHNTHIMWVWCGESNVLSSFSLSAGVCAQCRRRLESRLREIAQRK